MSYIQFAVVATLVIGLAMSCSDDQEQVEEAVQQEAQQEEYAQQQEQQEELDLIEDEVDELIGATAPEPEPASVSEPILVEEPAQALQFTDYWVFVPAAKVRAEPSNSAAVVGTVKYGEKFVPMNKKNGWINNGTGWVKVKQLTDRKTGFAKKSRIYYVKDGDVMVHAAPSKQAPAVSKMTKGERVIITGRKGSWLKVGDGQFVPRDNLVRLRPAH